MIAKIITKLERCCWQFSDFNMEWLGPGGREYYHVAGRKREIQRRNGAEQGEESTSKLWG